VFNQEIEYHYSIRRSTYLLGIPLYEGKIQLGVMVYLCDSKKMDIDSLYQLYSLTTLFFKIFIYQSKLSEIELKSLA
jgi:hypothetical protein